MKGGAWGLGIAAGLVGMANQFLPAFRSSLGVSGKTALVVSRVHTGHLSNPSMRHVS